MSWLCLLDNRLVYIGWGWGELCIRNATTTQHNKACVVIVVQELMIAYVHGFLYCVAIGMYIIRGRMSVVLEVVSVRVGQCSGLGRLKAVKPFHGAHLAASGRLVQHSARQVLGF
jgi:hypothetical protein